VRAIDGGSLTIPAGDLVTAVGANVLLADHLLGPEACACRGRATRFLDAGGREDLLDQNPQEPSGGVRPWEAIARPLVHDAATLTIDEPFAEEIIVEMRRARHLEVISQVGNRRAVDGFDAMAVAAAGEREDWR